MMKPYRAIFFDWDGTAVLNRSAPTEKVASAMKPLLHKGINLAIISGTTLENIAHGELHQAFSPDERCHLFYGLARGAENFRFDPSGELCSFASGIPSKDALALLHLVCFELHQWLLKDYDFPTDIVFGRPNYCKMDLMTTMNRGNQLYMQGNEVAQLEAAFRQHGLTGGVPLLVRQAVDFGQKHGLALNVTCDAKFLEIGFTLKSHNVDAILTQLNEVYGVQASECSYWGDEFLRIGEGIYGSDSFMHTQLTQDGDFFDVSDIPGERAPWVQRVGGGVDAFLTALEKLH